MRSPRPPPERSWKSPPNQERRSPRERASSCSRPIRETCPCVACDSISDLEQWIEENQAHHRRLGRAYEQTHTTRMVPKRMGDLVDGGSLYWVIKGQVSCRQTLVAVRPF